MSPKLGIQIWQNPAIPKNPSSCLPVVGTTTIPNANASLRFVFVLLVNQILDILQLVEKFALFPLDFITLVFQKVVRGQTSATTGSGTLSLGPELCFFNRTFLDQIRKTSRTHQPKGDRM